VPIAARKRLIDDPGLSQGRRRVRVTQWATGASAYRLCSSAATLCRSTVSSRREDSRRPAPSWATECGSRPYVIPTATVSNLKVGRIQAMDMAQDASDGANLAVLHRLPAVEDAIGACFGSRTPVKVSKGRVGGEQPGRSYVGDQPEDGPGVILHRTDTSLPQKAPCDERRSAGEDHARPTRGPQMCRSPGKLNQNFR
jgi:hypothetical protein